MEHVIEPAEASGGLVEIQDDTPKPTPVVQQSAGVAAESQKVHIYDVFLEDEQSILEGKTLDELKASALEAFADLNEGEFVLQLDTGEQKIKLNTQKIFENITTKFPHNDKHKLIVFLPKKKEQKQA